MPIRVLSDSVHSDKVEDAEQNDQLLQPVSHTHSLHTQLGFLSQHPQLISKGIRTKFDTFLHQPPVQLLLFLPGVEKSGAWLTIFRTTF